MAKPVRSYKVHSFLCNGGVHTEDYESMGVGTKGYFRRVVAGITGADKPAATIGERHVSLVALVVMETSDNQTRIVYDIYSSHFRCEHEEIAPEAIRADAEKIIHQHAES